MKLLYGVQGTGNGHITRARALTRHFHRFDIEVDYLFSGRADVDYFEMENFGNSVKFRQGLTFCHEAGRIQVLQTLQRNQFATFLKDVRNLDLSSYDAVLTDFEPITAWAAKRQGVASIGIGHQYAFNHPIPLAGSDLVSRKLMQFFAPANYSLGLHWHHFNSPILPPIVDLNDEPANCEVENNKYLVYLAFEDAERVIELLAPFKSYIFVIYGRFDHYQSLGNVQLKPFSRAGFCHDLVSCEGVISNAGFELSSEAIHLGKKLLVKPLKGQMEQLANACALEQLGLGMSMDTLDPHTIEHWLRHYRATQIHYPDVASEIVRWLAAGEWHQTEALAQYLWQKVRFETDRLEPGEHINFAA